MNNRDRQLSLEQYVDRLPKTHKARFEYSHLILSNKTRGWMLIILLASNIAFAIMAVMKG